MYMELIENHNVTNAYIEYANPFFIHSLKQLLGERPDDDKVIEYYKKIKTTIRQKNCIGNEETKREILPAALCQMKC